MPLTGDLRHFLVCVCGLHRVVCKAQRPELPKELTAELSSWNGSNSPSHQLLIWTALQAPHQGNEAVLWLAMVSQILILRMAFI